MDLQSAKMIGAGLAAIGAGAAAIGVGFVFGPFLKSALRNPAAADGQQGRLFLGFALAELLGLMAFTIALLILFVFELMETRASGGPAEWIVMPQLAQLPDIFWSQLFWLVVVFGIHFLRHRAGNASEDPGDGRPAREEDRGGSRARPSGAGRGRRNQAAYRAAMDASRAEAAALPQEAGRQARKETEAKVKAAPKIAAKVQGRSEDPRRRRGCPGGSRRVTVEATQEMVAKLTGHQSRS